MGHTDLQELPSSLSRPRLWVPGGSACFQPPELGGGRLSLTGGQGPTLPQPQCVRPPLARLWQGCGLSPAPSAVTGWGAAGGSPRNSGSPNGTPSTSPSVPQRQQGGRRLGWNGLPVERVQGRGEELGPGGAGGLLLSSNRRCLLSVPNVRLVPQGGPHPSHSWHPLGPHPSPCGGTQLSQPRPGRGPGWCCPERCLVSRWLSPPSDSERQARPLSLGQREAGTGLRHRTP